jgi:AcrR family transcriptional regulator
MGRPSLAPQRREEILAALERCVLRDGLACTTVQAVATEAGCKRTLINHYFANMDGLTGALLDKLSEDFNRSYREADPKRPGISALLDFLLRRPASRANELIGAFHRSGIESAKEPLARMYEGATSVLATYLRAEFPTASLGRCRSTAFALVCLTMSRYQLGGLGVATGRIKSLRASAQVLIEALEA